MGAELEGLELRSDGGVGRGASNREVVMVDVVGAGTLAEDGMVGNDNRESRLAV